MPLSDYGFFIFFIFKKMSLYFSVTQKVLVFYVFTKTPIDFWSNM